ncbi:unannotated protein [freshwater metagenome]|uniref:Unannotated protein n=1 Tax=freshwater metagenome TaxID=449393 RepID=A0A6J6U6W8_9ZZZZ
MSHRRTDAPCGLDETEVGNALPSELAQEVGGSERRELERIAGHGWSHGLPVPTMRGAHGVELLTRGCGEEHGVRVEATDPLGIQGKGLHGLADLYVRTAPACG